MSQKSEPSQQFPLLPRFKFKKVVGQGSYGRVYLAYDLKMKRDVAIKEPRKDINKAQFQDKLKRLERESQVASQFTDNNIVTAYDIIQTDSGNSYLVQQFFSGGTLRDLLEEVKYDQKSLCGIIKSHFNIEELRSLCLDLNIEFDDIAAPNDTRGTIVEKLIPHCNRRAA